MLKTALGVECLVVTPDGPATFYSRSGLHGVHWISIDDDVVVGRPGCQRCKDDVFCTVSRDGEMCGKTLVASIHF